MSRRANVAHLRRRRTARRRRHIVMAGVSLVLAAPYLGHLRALPDPAVDRQASAAQTRPIEHGAVGADRVALPFVVRPNGTLMVDADIVDGDGGGTRPRYLYLRVMPCAASGLVVSGGDTRRGRRP